MHHAHAGMHAHRAPPATAHSTQHMPSMPSASVQLPRTFRGAGSRFHTIKGITNTIPLTPLAAGCSCSRDSTNHPQHTTKIAPLASHQPTQSTKRAQCTQRNSCCSPMCITPPHCASPGTCAQCHRQCPAAPPHIMCDQVALHSARGQPRPLLPQNTAHLAQHFCSPSSMVMTHNVSA